MSLILGLRYLVGGRCTTISCSGCLAIPHIRGLCTRYLTKLFVGGLSGNTNEQVLRDAFSRYGQVLDVSVMINPQTGWSKGYGFVQFASETDADNAVNKMDGQVLHGKNITVNFAKPWKSIDVDPPRAVGPPSWGLEKNEEEENVGKKGKKKKDLPRAVGPPLQGLEKNEKKEKIKKKEKNEKNEKNEKKENKKKQPSSLANQTFVENLDD